MAVRDVDSEHLQRLAHFTIERANDAVYWIDENARFVRVNKATSDYLGYSRKELLSMTVFDVNPDMSPDLWPSHWSALQHERRRSFEGFHRAKDRSIIPVEISLNYIEFEGKEYSCAFVRNTTDRKKAENDLRNAFAEVEKLKNQLEAENVYLQEEINLEHSFRDIICVADPLKEVLHLIEQVATTDATVLILGETGTGKELLARAVHRVSHRSRRPLVKVNCATLPENLIESELFGHEKGAFTGAISRKVGRFELADGGTLFLDEIGELPLTLQPKLLRVLQEGEIELLGNPQTKKVDVRVIAATNRDLEEAISKGTFREDLYYRLNVFPIRSPALRERKEDIPLLVRHFVQKYATKLGRPIRVIPQRVMDDLKKYDWPGNVRELENVIERAVILTKGKTLALETAFGRKTDRDEAPKVRTLAEMERQVIRHALEESNWIIEGARGAAQRLDIPPSTLRNRIHKYGLKKP